MEKMLVKELRPEFVQEVVSTLTYKGKIAAIKLYMNYADCRLREAKMAVDKMSNEIEPGQAS